MIWGHRQDPNLWFRWYAWRPVNLVDGRWAWLEVLERRYIQDTKSRFDLAIWEYRPQGHGYS